MNIEFGVSASCRCGRDSVWVYGRCEVVWIKVGERTGGEEDGWIG